MKTSEEELDETVRAKLNLLSDITGGDGEGIVFYSKGSFGVQKVDKSRYRNVFSDDDICSLRNHRYHSEGNYVSAFDTNLIGRAGSLNTLPLLNEMPGIETMSQRQRVLKAKSDGKTVWALLDDGTILSKSGSKTESFDALGLLRKSFSFASVMPNDITDFMAEDDSYVISVRDFGAFRLAKEGNEHMTISDFGDIKSIINDGKHYILIRNGVSNSVALASLEGERLSEFNIVGSNGQIPESVSFDGKSKGFAVLGSAWLSTNPGKISHLWKQDAVGTGYFNCDSTLEANRRDAGYQYKVIDLDDGLMRIFGIRNESLFWLKYDSEGSASYIMTEVPLEYDDLLAAKADGSGICILTTNRVYMFDESKGADPIRSFALQYPIEDGGFAGKNAFGSKNGSVYAFAFPTLAYADSVVLPLEGIGDCTNIDIYVKAPKEASVAFSQGEGSLEPFYSLVVNGDERIFKLRPGAGSISMKIKGLGSGLLEAIVIHMNSFYSK